MCLEFTFKHTREHCTDRATAGFKHDFSFSIVTTFLYCPLSTPKGQKKEATKIQSSNAKDVNDKLNMNINFKYFLI